MRQGADDLEDGPAAAGRSFRPASLDLLNLLLIDVNGAIKPYLNVYLFVHRGWDDAAVGLVGTVSGLVGIAMQTPIGTAIDAVRDKRVILLVALVALSLATLLIAVAPQFWPVLAASCVLAAVGGMLSPAVATLTLGLFPSDRLARRFGRNAALERTGNVAIAGLIGAVGWLAPDRAVFLLVPACAIVSAAALYAIPRRAMRRWRSALLAAVLSLAPPAAAGTLHGTDVDPAALALQRVLPPPPAAGSEAAGADLRAVEAAVRARTPDDERRITANLPCTLDRFSGVLGPGFTAETMPVTAALIERVFQDGERAVLAAKAAIARPRPYTLEPDLATFGHRSASTSYPSGHATFGYLAATVLADLVPAKRRALFAFAASYADNRLIAGTHFPSDLEAGKIAAAVIAEVLLRDPRFQADLARAADEVARVGGGAPR